VAAGSTTRASAVGEAPACSTQPAALLGDLLVAIEARDLLPASLREGLGERALVAYFMVGVVPPDPSERVNVYLPKRLIAQADARPAELGMSRSSLFGLAIGNALSGFPGAASFPRSLVSAALEGAHERWAASCKATGEEPAP
jgi:hypothetical protein